MSDTSINSIIKTIPDVFNNIYLVNIFDDYIKEYGIEADEFKCIKEFAFTNFYNYLIDEIHPDDLEGYVNTLDTRKVEDILNSGVEEIRYKFRKKINENEYRWYTNIIRLVELEDLKKAVLVLVEVNEDNPKIEQKSKKEEELEKKEKIIFEAVSDAIIKLNRLVNINCSSHNLEIKSITEYIDNITSDLANSFPELASDISSNLISNVNQGEKTIIVVDDDGLTCNLISRMFKDIYKVVICKSGKEIIDLLEKNYDEKTISKKAKIVGLFLDLNMPDIDGFDVLKYMSSKNLLSRIPVIVISGDNQEKRDLAYEYPIADVLEKPFNVKIVKHRMLTLIKLYKSNNSLNEIVLTQNDDIKNVLRLALKSYLIDWEKEIKQVSSIVNIMINYIDKNNIYKFDDRDLNKITDASKYYNIGLYMLPKKLFTRNDYSDEEISIIKSSPQIGTTIFDSILYRNTDRVFNHYAKDIIMYHEERYDGKGYPSGLKGESIPIVAQIVSIAIEYDYLASIDEKNILERIKENSGKKFNPKVVNAFENVYAQIEKTRNIINKK